MINIVACASDNYCMQCGVLFYSICLNNYNLDIHFFLITDTNFSNENKKKLEKTISLFPNKKLDLVYVKDEQIDHVLQFENPYYTRHVFYRLFMGELLPLNVEKALYLDCDIIVRHSLSDLWKIDIHDYAIGCVHDAQEGKISQFNRLGFAYEKGYFNSGVLLANLVFWRKNNVLNQFVDYIKRESNNIQMPDQDVLNVVLQDSKLFIPFTYNLQSDFLFKKEHMCYDFITYGQELQNCWEDPIILHFSGARPWIEGCKHPYKDEFFKYKSQTIWKDEALWKNKNKFKEWIIQVSRPPLSKIGLCSIVPDPFNRNLKLKS